MFFKERAASFKACGAIIHKSFPPSRLTESVPKEGHVPLILFIVILVKVLSSAFLFACVLL